MRYLLTFSCWLILCALPVHAQQSPPPSTPLAAGVEQQLQQLTQSKLKQSLVILQAIAAAEGANMLPLYNTLLAGNLYFIKENLQLIAVVKAGTNTTYSDLLSAEALPALPKKAIKKIRVNNKLRVYLRNLIAELTLSAADPNKRLVAIQAVLGNLSSGNLKLIAQLRITETHPAVIALMDLSLSIGRALNAELAVDRIKAIELLGDSLEPQALKTLIKLSESYADKEDAQSLIIKKSVAKALRNVRQDIEIYGYVNQLFFGLSLGSVLLLAAIGLAITFGMMGVINMAHGEMIMLGAYTTYVVQLIMPNFIEYSLLVAIPMAFLVAGSVGILIERCVIRFLHGRPLETLLATFGISLILQQLVRSIFSPLNRQVTSPAWMSGSLEINPVLSLTYNRLYIVAFALLVFLALHFILKKTSLGLNVRAVSQNRPMAKAMGIRTGWVDAMTFGLGSGIAGIAGVALSQLTNVGPNLGQAYIIDSFMVVVFGGVGSLLGTLVAAFSLGTANKILEPTTGAVLASIFVLVFIILFIQKRPKGLFPQKGRAAE